MTDAHGGKIVFRSAVERINTVFNILDTVPLHVLAPVKPAKPPPYPTEKANPKPPRGTAIVGKACAWATSGRSPRRKRETAK